MNNPINFLQMVSQLKSNPREMLAKRFNLPQNTSNPNDILQHLMNTGQVSQEQYNRALQMAKQIKK